MAKEIPPIDFHPKPKSKGKKPKPPKLKTRAEMETLDVFKTVFSADAGAESSDPEEAFEKYIDLLSRPQLTRVERRIRRIKNKVLDTEEERQRRDFLCEKMSSAIHSRMETSAEQETLLKVSIKEKLDNLSIVDLERTRSGSLKAVRVDGQWLSIRALIQRELSEELARAQKLLEEGILVRYHRRYGAAAFIKRCISEYLV